VTVPFLAAAAYGVLEGWLAVDGSTDWWPMTPLAPDVDDDLILGPGDVAMPTVLDPSPHPVEEVPIARRRTPPKIRWLPMISGAVVVSFGIVWYGWAVASFLASRPVDVIDSTIQAASAEDLLEPPVLAKQAEVPSFAANEPADVSAASA
jgi:hypothetical protein